MHLVLFDNMADRVRLYPLTLTRPIAHLRLGILTILDKWKKHLPDAQIDIDTEAYLQVKYAAVASTSKNTVWVNARFLPDINLITRLSKLKEGDTISVEGQLLAYKGEKLAEADSSQAEQYDEDTNEISRTWDLFLKNGEEIRKDFALLTKGRKSAKLNDPHSVIYGDQVFMEEGANIKSCVLNSENGPIYIGKNTLISEGSLIRGPFALCDHSIVSMGTKVRGDSTVGPYSKIGGEVSNSILMGYSNKSHDGFIGNTVIGEWCNLGAGTNTSNLKNNYGPVRMWDYEVERLESTGLQFCGLVMGDHSKSAIGTNFNTGTTVGVGSNVFASGFPGNYLPSFTWGGQRGADTYRIDKTFETAERVMMRRNLSLSPEDKAILTYIFEHLSS